MPERRRSVIEMLVAMASARDTDSARVARLLHDEVGQVLSAAGLQLGVLRMDFREQAPDIAARITEIQDILERAIEQVRGLSYELNPQVVERAGLHNALDRLAARFRQRFHGSIRLLSDPSARVPLEAAGAMYRIAEYALDNAVRHSHAKTIEILVRPLKRAMALEVRDNGRGFDVEAVRKAKSGLGLLLIDHYALQAGLEVSIRSAAGKGTIVKILHHTYALRHPAR